jgi:hypothetical protein
MALTLFLPPLLLPEEVEVQSVEVQLIGMQQLVVPVEVEQLQVLA